MFNVKAFTFKMFRYVLRKIAAPPRELLITNEEIHVGLDIETQKELMTRLNVRFWTKRHLNDNSLIRNIGKDAKKKPYKTNLNKRCATNLSNSDSDEYN